MTKKVLIIGPPAVGKTTLTAEVFVELKKKNYNVELVTEYPRLYINTVGAPSSVLEQYSIFEGQTIAENIKNDNLDYLVIETGRISSYFYTYFYADHTDPKQRLVLQHQFKYFLDDLYSKRYDFIFYLPLRKLDDKWLKDGVRYQNMEEIQILDAHMNLVFTKLHKMDNIFVLDSPYGERVGKVLSIIL